MSLVECSLTGKVVEEGLVVTQSLEFLNVVADLVQSALVLVI